MLVQGASLLSALGLVQAGGWTYEKQNDWVNLENSQCGGKSNSPIDIITKNVKPATTDDIVDAPGMVEIINGLTFNASMTDLTDEGQHAIKFTPTKEPSNSKVKCAQFHFHFDLSEHTVNGKNYFAEVHMVCYKQEYADLNAAVAAGKSDSLAVLGFFIEKSDTPDANMQTIIDIYNAGNKDKVQVKLPTANTDKYYRYDGGLTTPTCNEIVLWTVFADTVKISSEQADAINKFAVQFRKNNRVTLPLNGREVVVYDKSAKPTESEPVEPPADDNTMIYVIIGIAGIALLIGIFMFMKSRSKKEAPKDDAEAQPMK